MTEEQDSAAWSDQVRLIVPDAQQDGWRQRVVGRSLGPAADRAVERGQALIAAATRLIQQSGEDFTMQKVASEAGLSLRAVYQHFGGKDDLLTALIEEAQLVFARLIRRRIAGFDDPLERLGAALYFMTDPRQHTDRDYNLALFRFVMRMSISSPEAISRARRPTVDLLTELIADAIAREEIEDQDPEIAAFHLVLAYVSYQLNANLGNATGTTELGSKDRFVRFCLLGLGADLPAGWEQRFEISDDEAEQHRAESVFLAGTDRGARARGRARA